MAKIEVCAIQYNKRLNNSQEIHQKLGAEIITERRPDGNSFLKGYPYPLKDGDWIVKQHEGFILISDKHFHAHYTAYQPNGEPKVYMTESNAKAQEKLTKALKHISRLPYSKERDEIIHDIKKSMQTLESLNW